MNNFWSSLSPEAKNVLLSGGYSLSDHAEDRRIYTTKNGKKISISATEALKLSKAWKEIAEAIDKRAKIAEGTYKFTLTEKYSMFSQRYGGISGWFCETF